MYLYIGHVCEEYTLLPVSLVQGELGGGVDGRKSCIFGGPEGVPKGVYRGIYRGFALYTKGRQSPKIPLFWGTQKLKSEKSHQSTTTTPNFYYYY